MKKIFFNLSFLFLSQGLQAAVTIDSSEGYWVKCFGDEATRILFEVPEDKFLPPLDRKGYSLEGVAYKRSGSSLKYTATFIHPTKSEKIVVQFEGYRQAVMGFNPKTNSTVIGTNCTVDAEPGPSFLEITSETDSNKETHLELFGSR